MSKIQVLAFHDGGLLSAEEFWDPAEIPVGAYIHFLPTHHWSRLVNKNGMTHSVLPDDVPEAYRAWVLILT